MLASAYSPAPSGAVPSALAGLTALFGMGRGGAPPPKTPTFPSGGRKAAPGFFFDMDKGEERGPEERGPRGKGRAGGRAKKGGAAPAAPGSARNACPGPLPGRNCKKKEALG